MQNTSTLFKSFYCLLALLASILLVSCSTTTTTPHVSLRSPFTQDPAYYLGQAQSSTGTLQQTYWLQATAAYFYYGNFAAGRSTLYKVSQTQLDPINLAQYQLLNARLALYDKQADRAISVLDTLSNTPNLTPQIQVEALKLRADAQQQLNQPIDSIKTLILITPLLTETADKDANQQNIWQIVTALPDEQLQPLSQDATQSILQGWAALALIVHTYTNQPQQLLEQLKNWQSQYPAHPASSLVSTDMSRIAGWMQAPGQVALLLPIKGTLAPEAQAVMNGFMAAYYRVKQQGLPTPQVKVYDTSAGSITELYQQAINEGANVIVGPLSKTDVATLVDKGNIRVPTLALNYSDQNSLPKNLFEFALSPQNDADTIADRAAQMGYHNAVTISPSGAWGDNIRQTFIKRWQQDSGKIVSNFSYKPENDFKSTVAALLNINESYDRKQRLSKLIGQPLSFSPRRRQDIDVIFLNAMPADARQILPLLRFYYAGDIPVYATSQIYSGTPNPSKDIDLNGVRFVVMPWAINPSPAAQVLRKDLMQLFPDSFKKYSLLYAFGIDAYNIMSHMGQLQSFPKFGINGDTGTLYIGADNRIIRKGEWAEFTNGQPKLITFDSNVIIPLQIQHG